MSDYTRVEFATGINLVYSKTYDALPVTTFLVESQPCMKNDVHVGAAHYLLEYEQAISCPFDYVTDNYYDPRFYSAGGLEISELAYLTDNLVLPTMIDKAPGFTKY